MPLSSQQALQHPRDLLEGGTPCRNLFAWGIAEILGILAPEPRFVRRSQRHDDIALELPARRARPAHTLRKKGADRLGGPPRLIGDPAILLDFRLGQACPMHIERECVSTLKDHKSLNPVRHSILLTTDH